MVFFLCAAPPLYIAQYCMHSAWSSSITIRCPHICCIFSRRLVGVFLLLLLQRLGIVFVLSFGGGSDYFSLRSVRLCFCSLSFAFQRLFSPNSLYSLFPLLPQLNHFFPLPTSSLALFPCFSPVAALLDLSLSLRFCLTLPATPSFMPCSLRRPTWRSAEMGMLNSSAIRSSIAADSMIFR